ncbi:MAG: hypothetical protein V4618_18265 [Pseudomonadota bacterium]
MALTLASCAPTYVWGDAQRVEKRLVEMVPLGSPPALLITTAKQRGWRIDRRNTYRSPTGSKTYMHDTHLDCRSKGGLVVPVLIEQYHAPFATAVESMWLFDQQHQLREVCVRKTVDAL